jgi:site-specific recombinase
MFWTKRATPDFIEAVKANGSLVPITDSRAGLDFLVAFFNTVRPDRGHRDAALNLEKASTALLQSPVLLGNLQNALLSQLADSDLSPALTESGIPLGRGYWQEFFRRIRHKILPAYQDPQDFLYVLTRVFYRKQDYRWVDGIPRESWIRFFGNLGLALHRGDGRVVGQLVRSLTTLSFQVAQLGLEREVSLYLPSPAENPFVLLSDRVRELEPVFLSPATSTGVLERIDDLRLRCYHAIDFVRENYTRRGASLHQTYLLLLLENRLDRICLLVEFLDQEPPALGNEGRETGQFVDFFRMLVRNENTKNSLREFMSQSLGYLAYQIAEHKGAKGSKYITSTRAEYLEMLRSSLGGGAWVCGMVIIKNLLAKLPMAIFWHGFAYSVNYSIGFVLIEESHTTLATKQPAFTASAVASSLDTRNSTQRPNLYNLAVTVAKVSRSQIASFLGNLLIVFPGTWLLAWLYELVFHHKLVEGEQASNMLRDQHPWQSLSLLYACFTGFFLFLSGIIAGYMQNKIRYGHISDRLQTHPLLRISMSARKLRRLADYVEKHAGMIVGNVALGFFLGMSVIVHQLFGIHFDIRHITIAAGNTSLAVYGLGFSHVDAWYLLTVMGGVLGIGFFNFLVSFSLAFYVAVKSRGIRLKDYPEFLGILWRYFRHNPLDFIRPRKREQGL